MIEIAIVANPDSYNDFEVSETSESYWQEKYAYYMCQILADMHAAGYKIRQMDASDVSALSAQTNNNIDAIVSGISDIYNPPPVEE